MFKSLSITIKQAFRELKDCQPLNLLNPVFEQDIIAKQLQQNYTSVKSPILLPQRILFKL